MVQIYLFLFAYYCEFYSSSDYLTEFQKEINLHKGKIMKCKHYLNINFEFFLIQEISILKPECLLSIYKQ